jgi:hypothetical protein
VDVTGTAKHVGPKGAIYLDNTVPAGGYTQADLDSVGFLFDNYLYPLDTTSFGRESDLDNNGVVVVLLTNQVNALSPDCNTSGSVILGFFYGNDLLAGNPGSNGGEVFYGLVPDPDNGGCSISHDFARSYLAPTFIHEFQHMISYNQHVLIRGGSTEETWLNEGLSMFAEELAGRQVPDAVCFQNDCLSQFAFFTLDNAYQYLTDPVHNYLVGPDRIPLPLEEYGSAWLFVRWLADHYASDATLGTDLTRDLDATTTRGASNVTRVTGKSFSSLVTNWQLANYLDDLPGFTPADPLLQYTSWNLRQVYASLNAQVPSRFPRPYPLEPPIASNGVFNETGTLLGGSGRHVLVDQDAGAPGATLKLTGSDGSTALPASAGPVVGVVRTR